MPYSTNSTTSSWQRARNPEQQEERRREILAASYRLFKYQNFAEVSLNAIAREAKLTKPSIYLYFTTREEIFLEIFHESFQTWIDDSLCAWSKLEAGVSSQEIAKAWVEAAWTNDTLRRLTPFLEGVIEHNVSIERLGSCVQMKKEASIRLRQALWELGISISESDTFDLMLYTLHLYGQFVLIEDNQGLKELLAQPDYSKIPTDFKGMVIRAATLLLNGMKESSR